MIDVLLFLPAAAAAAAAVAAAQETAFPDAHEAAF